MHRVKYAYSGQNEDQDISFSGLANVSHNATDEKKNNSDGINNSMTTKHFKAKYANIGGPGSFCDVSLQQFGSSKFILALLASKYIG